MKSIVYIILLWAMALPVSAQRGKDALLIEAAMSVGNEDGTERIFPGMCVKYLAGMGERAQLTASVGIWAFRNWANEPVFFKSILLGYRSNGKRMYIEPAAGVGIYTEKSGVYDYGYKEGYTYYMIDISLEAGYKWKNLSVAFQPQLLTDGAIPSDLWNHKGITPQVFRK